MHAEIRRRVSRLLTRWPRILPLAGVLVLSAAAEAGAQPAGEPSAADAADAAAPDAADAAPLRVAIKTAPPFVMEDAEGDLEGISVELWNRVADRLGRDTMFVRMELEEMLDAAAAAEVDAAIAAISITPEREIRLDLSHGYHLAGLGIAARPGGGAGSTILSAVRNLVSREFVAAVGALAVLLMIVGVVVWLAERRGNPDQFPRDPVKGIGNGFWFSAVTMTTVGYGDRAPATLPGRLVSLVWMFASIIVISAFTGTIASSLTAARFDGGIQGLDDLPNVRVGVVTGTTAESALRDRGIRGAGFDDVAAGLQAVADEEVDAFVHDHPILLHGVSERQSGDVTVLSAQFNLTSYAVAMPPGSLLLEDVNRAILEVTRDPSWSAVLRRYLGDQG